MESSPCAKGAVHEDCQVVGFFLQERWTKKNIKNINIVFFKIKFFQ